MSGKGIAITKHDREAIRLYRLRERQTLRSVGDALERSPRWVRRIENAESAIFTETDLVRMARFLKVRPDDLVARHPQ